MTQNVILKLSKGSLDRILPFTSRKINDCLLVSDLTVPSDLWNHMAHTRI